MTGQGETFGWSDRDGSFERLHRWALILALASPIAGLAILAAAVLGS